MRSPDTEQRLDREAIVYSYVPEVPLGHFEINAAYFQNRFDPVSDETIEEYRAAMENGKDFPPLQTIEREGRYIILDGHQRYAAALNTTRLTLDVYVLDLDDTNAQSYAHRVNLHHGTRIGRAARLGFALEDIKRVGDGQLAYIARQYDLPSATLRDEYHARQFKRRAHDLGSGITNGLHKTVQLSLQSIVLDEPFKAATRLASDAGLPLKQVKDLVAKVQAARSEAEALEVIRQRQESYKRNKRRPKSPVEPIFQVLMKLCEHNVDGLARMMTDDEYQRFRQVIAPAFDKWWSALNAVSLQKNVA